MPEAEQKSKFLYDWKLKLGILAAIVTPSVTATAAFFKLELRLNEKTYQVENRVNKIELDAERNFADKKTMQELSGDVRALREDMVEIKTLLKKKLK